MTDFHLLEVKHVETLQLLKMNLSHNYR